METLSFKMKSVGEFLKRRSSITNINIAPEYHVQNNKAESSKPQSSQAIVDIREELYDVKKQLAEREKELGEQREMLKDYISNRVPKLTTNYLRDKTYSLFVSLQKERVLLTELTNPPTI